MNFPAAAQERNDIMIPAEPIPLANPMVLPARNCRNAAADARSEITPNRREDVLELITHCWMRTHSLSRVNPYVTFCPLF